MEPAPRRAKTRKPEAAWHLTRQPPGIWPGISSNSLHGIRPHRLASRLSMLALRKFTVVLRQPPESQIRIEIGHHLVEPRKVQRLLAVAPRLVRIGMHFDQQ